MSTEIQAAIIGAVVGGLFAYFGIAGQSLLERRRERRAVATALLCELYVVQDLARLVRDDEAPANISAHVPTEASERFIDHIGLFDPDTVVVIMEAVRHAKDLQRELEVLEYRDGDHPRHGFLRSFADVVLGDIAEARPHLIATGGQSPSKSPSGMVRSRDARSPRGRVV